MKKLYSYRTTDLRIRISKDAINSMYSVILLTVQKRTTWFLFWRWRDQIVVRILIKEVMVPVCVGTLPEGETTGPSYVQGCDHRNRPVEIWRPEDFNLMDRMEKMWASYHQQEAGRLRSEQLFKKQLRDL